MRKPRRFLEDFRRAQALDAESEFVVLCTRCRFYPAAVNGQCFTCEANEAPPA